MMLSGPRTILSLPPTRHALALAGLLVFASLTQSATADESLIYVETDGYVTFEVEDTDVAENWILQMDDNGYLGTGYLEWQGDNFFRAADSGNGRMLYRFRISSPGNYELRVRSRINFGDNTTEHNDSWIRLDTGENVTDEYGINGWTKMYMNVGGSWAWQTKTKDHDGQDIRQYFEAGDHTFELSGRSFGHAIDRVVLYRYGDIDFHNGRFNARPVSPTVPYGNAGNDGDDGDDDNVQIEGGGVMPVEPVDANNINARLLEADTEWTSGYCTDGALLLSPVDDLHDVNGELIDTELLDIDPDNSRALLKFDLRAISQITSAEIRYHVAERTGDGDLAVSLLDHSQWTIDKPDGLPTRLATLATASGIWQTGMQYATVLDHSILPSDVISLSLELNGGSGFDVASTENETLGPAHLVLKGTGDFCAKYAQAAAELSPWQPGSEPDDANTDADNGDEPGNEPPVNEQEDVDDERDAPTMEPGSDESAAATQSSSGSGSLSGVFALLVLLIRRRICQAIRVREKC